MGGGPAVPAELDLRPRLGLVLAGVAHRHAFDGHFGRIEIAPLGARLAAQGAVAYVDVVGPLVELEANLAAVAGELLSGSAPPSAKRCVQPSAFASSASDSAATVRQPSARSFAAAAASWCSGRNSVSRRAPSPASASISGSG